MRTPSNQPVVTPWLRRDQWSRFCEVFAGEENLPPSYDDWLEEHQQETVSTGLAGFETRRVEIDVEGLVAWCKTGNRVVDILSMMLYASAVAANHDRPGDGLQSPGGLPRFASRTIQVGGIKLTIHTPDDTPSGSGSG